MAKTDKITTIVAYIIASIGAIVSFFPIYWMIQNAFKPAILQFSMPPTIIFQPTLEHFNQVLNSTTHEFVVPYLINSSVIVLSATAIMAFLGSIAAYGLTRLEFRGRKALSFWILSQRLLPGISIIVPIYLLYSNIGFVDTYQGMILIYVVFGLPFLTWLMLGFFSELPREVEESAMVDGCSRFRTFYSISLRLVAPGLAAATILTMIFTWNEFLFGIILTGKFAKTLPAALTMFMYPMGSKGFMWGPMCAFGVIMSLPMIIAGVFIQRYIVRGLTFGAVKG